MKPYVVQQAGMSEDFVFLDVPRQIEDKVKPPGKSIRGVLPDGNSAASLDLKWLQVQGKEMQARGEESAWSVQGQSHMSSDQGYSVAPVTWKVHPGLWRMIGISAPATMADLVAFVTLWSRVTSQIRQAP